MNVGKISRTQNFLNLKSVENLSDVFRISLIIVALCVTASGFMTEISVPGKNTILPCGLYIRINMPLLEVH